MMIPSENVASYAVEEAVGSAFGNKYSEGYPNRRYYQGQEFADKLESLVIERAKKLFKVAHVNVQALSGSPANFAVYTALLKPGATIMGLSLSSGGHLTHGARFNASSIYFNAVNYNVRPDGYIDYEALKKQAKKLNQTLLSLAQRHTLEFLTGKNLQKLQIASEHCSWRICRISRD